MVWGFGKKSRRKLLHGGICQFSVRDGRRVLFWEDIWCGPKPLKTTFPNLYIMAGSKGAYVADYWDLEGAAEGWNLRFLRSFNDRELDQVYNLFNVLFSSRVQPEMQDRLVWKVSKDGLFSIKSYYDVLETNMVVFFPNKMV